MKCTEARELLLEADLRAPENAEFEGHLKVCEACSSALDRLLAAEAQLGTALAVAAASVAPELDPARVRTEAARRRRIPWRRTWVPLAAAAALAGVAFFGPWERPPPGAVLPPGWAFPTDEPGPIRPVVESGSHDHVAVLPTKNPDITVVWFMDS